MLCNYDVSIAFIYEDSPRSSMQDASPREIRRIPLASGRMIVATFVVAIVASGLWIGSNYLGKSGPVAAAFASDVTDLGEGEPGQVLSGTLALRNLGNEPLDFTAQAGCQCAELNPKEG